MRHNHLRELLRAGKPSLGTHVISPWPAIYELVGRSGAFDYVEFVAEEAPFDLHDLDGIGRAVELFPDMGAMIKVDDSLREFTAARAVNAGFDSVLFADIRAAHDARAAVRCIRPETPVDGGGLGSKAGPRLRIRRRRPRALRAGATRRGGRGDDRKAGDTGAPR